MNGTKWFIVIVLLTASALITGTGAFSLAAADRSASINVAGDDGALLQLTPYSGPDGNGDIADITNGQLQISNLNVQSNTDFANVFNVSNHGTQTVAVWIVDEGDHPESVTFYNPEFGGASSMDSGVESVEGQENAVALDVGESLVVSLQVDTTGFGQNVALIDTMIIYADASIEGAPGPGDSVESGDNGHITICHITGSDTTLTIEINENALQAHLDHGDSVGPC